MKHISLTVKDEIKNILPDILEKDLQANEIICPTCHGLGVVKRHQPFGLKEKETDEGYSPKMNWYDNEYLTFCPTCFDGVVSLCKYCGKPIVKGYISKCDCEQYQKKELQKQYLKYQETIAKAKEINPNETEMMLYDENSDRYFSDVDEFVEYFYDENYESEDDLLEVLPQVLWVCTKSDIFIDAGDVIGNACDDLHEDASDNCDYNSLQKVLDKWCNEQSGTTTYYHAYKEYIKVKKEWFTK
ncbi:MAG: hypothetical protein RSF81_08520 [Oscillospiraceae bacterium]